MFGGNTPPQNVHLFTSASAVMMTFADGENGERRKTLSVIFGEAIELPFNAGFAVYCRDLVSGNYVPVNLKDIRGILPATDHAIAAVRAAQVENYEEFIDLMTKHFKSPDAQMLSDALPGSDLLSYLAKVARDYDRLATSSDASLQVPEASPGSFVTRTFAALALCNMNTLNRIRSSTGKAFTYNDAMNSIRDAFGELCDPETPLDNHPGKQKLLKHYAAIRDIYEKLAGDTN
jgi:hypothetical protein